MAVPRYKGRERLQKMLGVTILLLLIVAVVYGLMQIVQLLYHAL